MRTKLLHKLRIKAEKKYRVLDINDLYYLQVKSWFWKSIKTYRNKELAISRCSDFRRMYILHKVDRRRFKVIY